MISSAKNPKQNFAPQVFTNSPQLFHFLRNINLQLPLEVFPRLFVEEKNQIIPSAQLIRVNLEVIRQICFVYYLQIRFLSIFVCHICLFLKVLSDKYCNFIFCSQITLANYVIYRFKLSPIKSLIYTFLQQLCSSIHPPQNKYKKFVYFNRALSIVNSLTFCQVLSIFILHIDAYVSSAHVRQNREGSRCHGSTGQPVKLPTSHNI